jgi:hypothetical protein
MLIIFGLSDGDSEFEVIVIESGIDDFETRLCLKTP